jgi:hypothetical protein
VRNALVLLVVVALVIVTAGAINHSVAFDVDWVAGTWRAVSLFWVAAAVALVVLLAGLAAALLARRGAVRAQRKLETELDATYLRVRELESLAPAAAATAAAPAAAVAAPAGDPSASAKPAQIALQASAAPTTAAQTLAAEPPPEGETTVTVVAAHGSARVTQVLPAPVEPEADSTSAEQQRHETAAADATALTRVSGDCVGPTAADEPDVPAVEASDGEASTPD